MWARIKNMPDVDYIICCFLPSVFILWWMINTERNILILLLIVDIIIAIRG